MILSALNDYYQRLAMDPKVDIAPPGFEYKAIDFVIVIDSRGEFVDLQDVREGSGRRRKGRAFLVPKAVKRSSGIAANLLWDSVPYVLGFAPPQKGKEQAKLDERAVEQNAAFVEKIQSTLGGCGDRGIDAVLAFFASGGAAQVVTHDAWSDIMESGGGNMSFRLANDQMLTCQRESVVESVELVTSDEAVMQTCQVTGEQDVPAVLHTAIKNVWGAQSSGANIVSFNLDAACSHGKSQGANAPVGSRAEFRYTAALNYLLATRNQRMQVGDASTVFWAGDACQFEDDFPSFLAPPKGSEDVSYAGIRSLLSSFKTGIPATEDDLRFHVLGLAPNASRISIRFWYEGRVGEIKEHLVQHFRDLEMVRAPHDPEYLSLFRILVSTATESKAENIPPNLGGELTRSILTGGQYPRTLFGNAIRRCKAERKVNFPRVAIIKAFLFRNARMSPRTIKEVSSMLDCSYDNIGYALGRLFAVLERIQETAHGTGLNKTIRDTYFGAAASTPQITFSRLDNLAVHHLSKIRRSGKNTVWLERLKQEVYGLIPAVGIPATLSLEDQGRLIVGYHHQRQYFFTAKEQDKETSDE